MKAQNEKKVKLRIKKGDKVVVIAGRAKGGKPARVLAVFPQDNKATVEGMNVVKRHTKPNAQNPNGGIIEKEAPIHISNLKLVDGKGNVTRVASKVVDGKKVRVSKKSGEVIE